MAFPRESNTPPSRKRFPAWALMGDEGRCVGGQSWTWSCWCGGGSCPEQAKELGAFLLQRSKENEKAPWKALRDKGPALVASGLKAGDLNMD